MLKKGIKYLTIIIICELLAIPAVMLVKHFETKAYAMAYKAHNSALGIEKFVISVKSIRVSEGYTGTQCTVWQGTPTEVDIASQASLSAALNITGTIKSGKWTVLMIDLVGQPKVTGSVTVGGTPYYTKTAHTGYVTGPAEPEEMNIFPTQPGGAFIQTVFPYEFNGTSSSGGIYVLMDMDYALTYYDGTGTNPRFSGNTTPAMYFNKSSSIITIGAPAIKELYEFSDTTAGALYPNDHNLITMLYDSNGNLVAGGAAPYYKNDTGINSMLNGHGFTNQNDPYYADGIHALSMETDTMVNNGDGTYKLKLTMGGVKNQTGSDTKLNNFAKTTHSGTWTTNNYTGGNFATATTVTTGSYNCVKLQ